MKAKWSIRETALRVELERRMLSLSLAEAAQIKHFRPKILSLMNNVLWRDTGSQGVANLSVLHEHKSQKFCIETFVSAYYWLIPQSFLKCWVKNCMQLFWKPKMKPQMLMRAISFVSVLPSLDSTSRRWGKEKK